VLSGVVGAAGGLGGFCLPLMLGGLCEQTGTFAYGFLACAAVSLACVPALAYAAQSWQGAFVGQGGRAHGAVPGAASEELAPADSALPSMTAPSEVA
jgi:nitrate/nitrite transporter NarK